MHFFLSCISSQGTTLSSLAAVLYLFHIFHMVSSRFLLQSQHCTVFRVKLYVLLSYNSLSKYFVKITGPPLSSFSICTERTTCRHRKTWNWWAANRSGTQRAQANSFTPICYCLQRQRQENYQEGEHKLQVSVTGATLKRLLSFKLF